MCTVIHGCVRVRWLGSGGYLRFWLRMPSRMITWFAAMSILIVCRSLY